MKLNDILIKIQAEKDNSNKRNKNETEKISDFEKEIYNL